MDLPNREGTLVPGMYVDVAFQLQENGLYQVPAAAMVFRSSGPQVAVVEPDGHVRFRKVTIARDEGSAVELGSGVAAGDKVALNISSQISDGDLVAVNESAGGSSSSGQASADDSVSAPVAAAPPAGAAPADVGQRH